MKAVLDANTANRLAQIGRIGDSDPSRMIELVGDLKADDCFLTSKDPDLSFELVRHDPWDDACALVRGLVIAENAGISLLRGSVSLVKYAYRVLERRNPVSALEVASWIVDHSDNDYIPFEMRKIRHAFSTIRRSARTWQECRDKLDLWQDQEWATQKAASAELQEQGARAVERRRMLMAVGERCAVERHMIQTARSAARQQLMEALSQATAQERLEHLAWDDSHGLGYYPEEFAQVPPEAFASATEQTRARLLKKLAVRRRRPWKSLYLHLVELNRPYDHNR